VMNTCYTTLLSCSYRRIRQCCDYAWAWKSLLPLRSVSPPFCHYLPWEKIKLNTFLTEEYVFMACCSV
jgi:hypothetical protein